MSINDYVSALVTKSQYGMKDYYLPSNEMLLKSPAFGKSDKNKNMSFIAQIEKTNAWVPSSAKYQLGCDWMKTQT